MMITDLEYKISKESLQELKLLLRGKQKDRMRVHSLMSFYFMNGLIYERQHTFWSPHLVKLKKKVGVT